MVQLRGFGYEVSPKATLTLLTYSSMVMSVSMNAGLGLSMAMFPPWGGLPPALPSTPLRERLKDRRGGNQATDLIFPPPLPGKTMGLRG